MRSFQTETKDELETKRLGFNISQDIQNLKEGNLSIIFLSGDLGTGKNCVY